MAFAWALYARMLATHAPEAAYDVWLPSDGEAAPTDEELGAYGGIIWTGCDLSIVDLDNPSVATQIDFAKRVFQLGNPSFGSCWGLQMAVVAAGGEVRPNPRGREMFLARKVYLTPEGKAHPMMSGKPPVFEPFISHDDEVTRLPEGATLLAGNAFSRVQAAEVRHAKGVFWATQYHPEYDLNEMACLMVAREEKLTRLGFFQGHRDFAPHIERIKELAANPDRKDLRWQLAVDDEVLDPAIRQAEFVNWLGSV